MYYSLQTTNQPPNAYIRFPCSLVLKPIHTYHHWKFLLCSQVGDIVLKCVSSNVAFIIYLPSNLCSQRIKISFSCHATMVTIFDNWCFYGNLNRIKVPFHSVTHVLYIMLLISAYKYKSTEVIYNCKILSVHKLCRDSLFTHTKLLALP